MHHRIIVILKLPLGSDPSVPRFYSTCGRIEMSAFARRIGMGLLVAVLAAGPISAQGWQHVGNVSRVEKLKVGAELTAGKAKVRVTVFRDGVFRVRVAPNGTFPKDF